MINFLFANTRVFTQELLLSLKSEHNIYQHISCHLLTTVAYVYVKSFMQ